MNYLYDHDDLVSLFSDEQKGVCVVARKPIEKGTLISTSVVAFIETADLNESSEFHKYLFYWNDTTECITFGIINLLNHSENSNVSLERDYTQNLMSIVANRNIDQDEELSINYECELWFDVV